MPKSRYSDAKRWPYVQDLDGRWHKRPADDEWTRDGSVQAHTLCGMSIGSVHVSQYDPRLEALPRDAFCPCMDPLENDGSASIGSGGRGPDQPQQFDGTTGA